MGAAAGEPGTEPAAFTQPIPYDGFGGKIVISPNGSHIAYWEKRDGQDVVVLDGKAGKPYALGRSQWREVVAAIMPGIYFSPDGARVAYAVIDPQQKQAPGPRPRYSPTKGKQRMIVDGIEGAWYDDVDMPSFSADNLHVVYAARRGERWTVVADGKEAGSYEMIGLNDDDQRVEWGTYRFRLEDIAPIFSTREGRLAYGARKGDRWSVIIDGKGGKEYDWVNGITFSPDGKHVAYAAGLAQRAFIVEDGKEGPAHEFVRKPLFSPDGKRLAYVAIDGGFHRLAVDGKEGKAYQEIKAQFVQFSENSRHIAYIAIPANAANVQIVVHDAQEGPAGRTVGGVVLSPDGKRIAYFIRQGDREEFMFDGKKIADCRGSLVFSPDSAHVAYLVRRENETIIMRDGTPLELPKDLDPSRLSFSPDGRHLLCYGSSRDNSFDFISVDGQPGAPYKRILYTETENIYFRQRHYFFFTAPDRFHYFAIKDGAIYRVEGTTTPE